MLPTKTALITDLDNTLFDWVEIWVNCFGPMLDKLVELSAVPRETLIPEIRAVHQRHGTSEYALLIDELPSLRPMLANQPATQVFAPAIEIYREKRREWLKLYPTVAETLLKIKGRGTIIVGYTESMAFYSNYRLRRLGLDGILDFVFCPKDHQLPTGMSAEDLRKYPAEHYELKYTKQDFTPEGSKKPDTAVLNAIISDLGLKKSECVFVGDSLMKDVAMALDCGVSDVWAGFHGYTCTDDCSGHEAGCDWAERHDIEDPNDCGGHSDSFIEGCQAYAIEHQEGLQEDETDDLDSEDEPPQP